MEAKLAQPGKQLGREQVREMVRIHLELTNDRRDASDAWIDARFDRFDADGSGTVDDGEWEALLRSMEPQIVTLSTKPPWFIEMEVRACGCISPLPPIPPTQPLPFPARSVF
jgi:hypothetical protein